MAKPRDTRYYAVRDHITGDMTFWYRDRKGRIQPWPRSPLPRYGPHIWRRLNREPGPHDSLLPEGLSQDERSSRWRTWHQTVRRPWMDAVLAEIDRDGDAAMARFASFQSRCCICAKALTDAESKVNGIGPECRKACPDSFVAAVQAAMSCGHR